MNEYDADDEYDIDTDTYTGTDTDTDDEDNKIIKLDKQIFLNIGIYMMRLSDNICQCIEDEAKFMSEKRRIKSVSSDLFTLCSEQTDDTVFKYYISDENDIELT